MIQWVSGTSPRERRERLAGSLNDLFGGQMCNIGGRDIIFKSHKQ